MHTGGNKIYGLHVIHNGLFAECEVLNIFWGLCGPRTRTRTCKLVIEEWGSSTTRTFLEDNNAHYGIAESGFAFYSSTLRNATHW